MEFGHDNRKAFSGRTADHPADIAFTVVKLSAEIRECDIGRI